MQGSASMIEPQQPAMTSKGAATTTPQFTVESPAMQQPGTMTVEVRVVSGEEVRVESGRALVRGAYAVVHAASSAARTRVDEDRDCNGYPYWNEAVRVALPERSAAIDVEICRRRSDGRVESVAAARVPVADFSVGPPGHLHCLSYRLFDSGSRMTRRNGIINITVKNLGGAGHGQSKPPAPPAGKAVDDAASCSSGSSCGVTVEGKLPAAAPGGAVMGYPVGFTAAGYANGKGSL